MKSVESFSDFEPLTRQQSGSEKRTIRESSTGDASPFETSNLNKSYLLLRDNNKPSEKAPPELAQTLTTYANKLNNPIDSLKDKTITVTWAGKEQTAVASNSMYKVNTAALYSA